ncbi:MAG: hypothetical protein KJ977_00325 [Candidatus Omnitrophica bacterium]|nr:hypothetical protein [Candidatus Omnitrophota bacterium]MBU2265469.1 hypothetical protein [Candidatus Omnitrophota bacterium]
MRSLTSIFLAVLVMGNCFVLEPVCSQPSKGYLLGTLEILVDEALLAYNTEDYLKFFEYFAKEMNPITTEQYFRAVYINGYKSQLGDLVSKQLIKEESLIDPDFPMLVYQAVFTKNRDVVIIVNFTKEYDNYRIERIRFDRVLSADETIGR